LDRKGGGPDDSFSLEPEGLKALCDGALTAWQALGGVNYGKKASENVNTKFRRSLYFVSDIKKGEVITEEHVRSIRPGYGMPPKALPSILGKTVVKDVERGTPVSSDLLDN